MVQSTAVTGTPEGRDAVERIAPPDRPGPVARLRRSEVAPRLEPVALAPGPALADATLDDLLAAEGDGDRDVEGIVETVDDDVLDRLGDDDRGEMDAPDLRGFY